MTHVQKKRASSLLSLYKVRLDDHLEKAYHGDPAKGSLLSVDVIEAQDGEVPGVDAPRMSWNTKIVHTVLIFMTFLGFGFCRGIYGPTLLELRRITGVSLEQISMLFTCLGVGGIAGSLTFGHLFDRFNPLVLFAGAMSSLASITAIIPWLSVLPLMMGACAAHSFVYSGLAIGCNVTLFRIWRERSRSIFLSMHLLYTVGGFIAPLISEPFLTPREASIVTCTISNRSSFSVQDSSETSGTGRTNATVSRDKHVSLQQLAGNGETDQAVLNVSVSNQGANSAGRKIEYDKNNESRIFITFLIVSLYLLTVAILWFILMVYMRNKKTGEYWKDYKPRDDLPCRGGASLYRLIATILFMVFNSNVGGQETLYTGLLFTFAVEHVSFTPTQASFLVAMLFTAIATGRFCSIFIGHLISTAFYVLLFNLAGSSLAALTLAYFTTSNTVVLWVCTIVQGLCMSTMYTMGLLWATDFMPITASFASIYTIAFTCGMMVWPPLTSSLMNTFSPGWFPYMSFLLVIGYATAMVLLAILYKLRHKFKDPSQKEEVVRSQKAQGVDIIAHSVHSVSTV